MNFVKKIIMSLESERNPCRVLYSKKKRDQFPVTWPFWTFNAVNTCIKVIQHECTFLRKVKKNGCQLAKQASTESKNPIKEKKWKRRIIYIKTNIPQKHSTV